jgi:hypothetical protein
MANEITITLRGGQELSGVRQFRPGEAIQGSISVTPESSLKCNHLNVRAVWHTEGRGDRDRGVGSEVDIYQGELTAGVPFHKAFHLYLPNEPWSYAGHYVNIVWEIEATIDVSWARDPKGSVPIILTG